MKSGKDIKSLPQARRIIDALQERVAELENAPVAYGLANDVEILQAKVEKLTAALGSLVALKTHKSIRGKDAHYLRNQPAAWEQARAALSQEGEKKTALQRFTECDGWEELDPIERLRFFCSCAMTGQDWLDVEQFFDEVE